MAAMFRSKKGYVRIPVKRSVREARSRQERIIPGIDYPDRDFHVLQILKAAAFLPVMSRITETMQGGRVASVEIMECLQFGVIFTGEKFRVLDGLEPDLVAHQAHESFHVNQVRSFSEPCRGGSKVTGYGETNSGLDPVRHSIGVPAEVDQGQVPPHTETDQDNNLVIMAGQGMADHGMEIIRRTVMGKARLPVNLAAAATKIPRQNVPIAAMESIGHPGDIMPA